MHAALLRLDNNKQDTPWCGHGGGIRGCIELRCLELSNSRTRDRAKAAGEGGEVVVHHGCLPLRRWDAYAYAYTHTHTHTYIYIYRRAEKSGGEGTAKHLRIYTRIPLIEGWRGQQASRKGSTIARFWSSSSSGVDIRRRSLQAS